MDAYDKKMAGLEEKRSQLEDSITGHGVAPKRASYPDIPEKRDFKSGTTSTKQPRLSLIPHAGLVNAAKRFELGIERHGEKAWNNLSPNQAALDDTEWLIERCSHAIEHLYSLIDYLKLADGGLEHAREDAGAVAWCGLVLGQALSEDRP